MRSHLKLAYEAPNQTAKLDHSETDHAETNHVLHHQLKNKNQLDALACSPDTKNETTNVVINIIVASSWWWAL